MSASEDRQSKARAAAHANAPVKETSLLGAHLLLTAIVAVVVVVLGTNGLSQVAPFEQGVVHVAVTAVRAHRRRVMKVWWLVQMLLSCLLTCVQNVVS